MTGDGADRHREWCWVGKGRNRMVLGVVGGGIVRHADGSWRSWEGGVGRQADGSWEWWSMRVQPHGGFAEGVLSDRVTAMAEVDRHHAKPTGSPVVRLEVKA